MYFCASMLFGRGMMKGARSRSGGRYRVHIQTVLNFELNRKNNGLNKKEAIEKYGFLK